MAKELKRRMVAEYKTEFGKYKHFIIVGYSGKEAGLLTDVRRRMRRSGVTIKVIKNSLAALALGEIGFEPLVKFIDGPSALCFGGDDIVELARVACTFDKAADKLVVKGGWYEGVLAEVKDINRFATIPPREILYAQIAGTLSRPLAGLAGAMSELLAKSGRLFKALAQQKETSDN